MTSLRIDAYSIALVVAQCAAVTMVLRAGARRGPIGAWRVVLALVALGATACAGVVLGGAFGFREFALMRLLYVSGVVAIPLVAGGLLVARARGSVAATRTALALAVFGLVPAPVGAWATFVEPNRLVVETATLPLPLTRAGRAPVRIAVLADLQTDHIGDHEREAIDRIMAEAPDLIFIPGDIFQGRDADWERERPALRALLERLDAPGGVFYVVGDVDPPEHVLPLLEGTKIRPLLDRSVSVRVRDRKITIGGVSFAPERVLDDLTAAPGDDDVRILLCHRPDVALQLDPNARVDLTVAGHTHGGQVVLPGFGPLMTLSRVPRDVAAGGLHRMDGNPIYVSRGVGMERLDAPRLRFCCPPEVSLITIASPAVDVP